MKKYNQLIQLVCTNYDTTRFKTFGFIKDKKLYFTKEEAFYLKQLNYIKYDNIKDYDLGLYTLYSWLRRSSKIVKCPEHNDIKYIGYYIIYENIDAFNEDKIEFIVTLFDETSLNIDWIDETQNIAKELSLDKVIVLAMPSGSSITFIKLSELILQPVRDRLNLSPELTGLSLTGES